MDQLERCVIVGYIGGLMLLIFDVWYIRTFFGRKGSFGERLRKFIDNKINVYCVVLMTSFAVLSVSVPYATMQNQDSPSRAYFKTLQEITMYLGVTFYRKSIEQRSIMILDKCKTGKFMVFATWSLLVLDIMRLILDLLSSSTQSGQWWFAISMTVDVLFGSVCSAVIGTYSMVFFLFIRKSGKSLQSSRQRYYVKEATYSIHISNLVALCAATYILVDVCHGTLQEVAFYLFVSSLLLCHLVFNLQKVELTNMYSQIAEDSKVNSPESTAVTTPQFLLETKADIQTRIVAVPGYQQMQLTDFDIDFTKILGSGADGQVVKANVVDDYLQSQLRTKYRLALGSIVVAIKLIGQGTKVLTDVDATELDPEAEVDSTFLQEVSIMSSLQGHPSIAVMFGYLQGQVNGIAMMLYQGSLADLILNTAVKTFSHLSITHQVASGLEEMHKYGIVHCDIKKNNILYSMQPDGTVKTYITDFGVSQVKLSSEKVRTRVNVKLLALSLPYAAPEVLEAMFGHKIRQVQHVQQEAALFEVIERSSTASSSIDGGDVDSSRDIYALGVLMWEMLYCESAWTALNAAEMFQIVVIDHKRPLYLEEDSNTAYVNLMQQCWDSEPSRRLQARQVCSEVLDLVSQR